MGKHHREIGVLAKLVKWVHSLLQQIPRQKQFQQWTGWGRPQSQSKGKSKQTVISDYNTIGLGQGKIKGVMSHTYDGNAALVSGMANRGLRWQCEGCESQGDDWVVWGMGWRAIWALLLYVYGGCAQTMSIFSHFCSIFDIIYAGFFSNRGHFYIIKLVEMSLFRWCIS